MGRGNLEKTKGNKRSKQAIPLRWSWFWKTLRGYTVTFINVDYEHVVTHRPFRQPLMESTRMTKKPLKGKAYEMIVYDEALLLTPEQLDKVNDLAGIDFGYDTDIANPQNRRGIGGA